MCIQAAADLSWMLEADITSICSSILVREYGLYQRGIFVIRMWGYFPKLEFPIIAAQKPAPLKSSNLAKIKKEGEIRKLEEWCNDGIVTVLLFKQ